MSAQTVAHGERTDQVWTQLARVTDPELDEPVTELGFIERVTISEVGRVDIAFRLPTYWCAANFAFLMADDMRLVVGALPWVVEVRPMLLDHMYADEVNRGVARGASFKQSFGDLASDESLEALRERFRRKAFLRRQEALLLALMAKGLTKSDLARMTVTELERLSSDTPDMERNKARYLEFRRIVPAPPSGAGLAFVSVEGEALPFDGFEDHLRTLRSVRINMEFNGALCRGLLAARRENDGCADREPELIDFIARGRQAAL
jgi:metal-sulfur cluster biosynthetic enzyme